MNTFKISVMIIAVLLSVSIGHAKNVAGIHIPDVLEISQPKLILNGAGIRKKFFIKVYVGALYLKEKGSQPEKIILADDSMAIKLHMISSMITSEKMEAAIREGFQNSTGGNVNPIQTQIEAFISVFKENLQEKDIFDLVYSPGKGVEVYKNGNLHSLIPGLDFKQALFGIWLCHKPAQKSLKAEMLGL